MSFTVLGTTLHTGLGSGLHAVVHARAVATSIRTEEGTGPDASVRKVAALAGYVSYGLMWLTLVWGIVTTTGWAMKFIRRSTVYGGHMTLAITTLAFTLFHAATYIFQTQEHFSIVDAFVPFAGEAEVAIGIIAFELALAVAVSVWFQRKLTYRRWHLVHFVAYPVFALSLIHVFTTSAEARGGGPITLILAASTLGLIVLSVLRAIPHLPLTSKARISHVEP